MPDGTTGRRDFLSLATLSSLLAALGTALAGVLRLPKPAVLPGPSRIYKLGDPAQYPLGSISKLEAEQAYLFRDERGFHAISAVCTHLGCIVAHGEEDGFACPCHGSKFRDDGSVTGGPAPTGLAWLELSFSPDGQLQLNAGAEVPRGTKLQV